MARDRVFGGVEIGYKTVSQTCFRIRVITAYRLRTRMPPQKRKRPMLESRSPAKRWLAAFKRWGWSKKVAVLNLAVGVVLGFFAAVVAIWVGRKERSSDLIIAQRSGQFDRARLDVGLGGASLPSGEIELFVGAPFRKGEINAFYLPLQIANSGEKSLEDVSVVFRFHSLHGVRFPDGVGVLQSSSPGPSRLGSEVGPYEFVTWNIARVDPGARTDISEPMALPETHITDRGTFTTADGRPIQIHYSVDYSLEIVISVAARDTRGWNGVFSVAGVQAVDIDDLTEKVISAVERDCFPHEEPNIIDRLFGWTPTAPIRDLLLVFPQRGELLAEIEGARLYAARLKKSGDIRILRVSEPFAVLVEESEGTDVSRVLKLKCKASTPELDPKRRRE